MITSIAFIVAMESERHHLDSLMPGWEPVEGSVWPTIRNEDLVCITSGIGMVAAAAATEYAISTFNPSIVMNFGCAGAHHRDLFPGDVVIGNRLIHQGRMRFAPNGDIIPFPKGFQVPGETEMKTDLYTDETLRYLAEGIARSINLNPWPEESRVVSQTDRAPIVKTGTVSSGDIWLQNEQFIDDAHQRTGSLCEDMEAAAIAQICAFHDMPFLTVKDISNSEFHEATQFEGTSSALPSTELGLRAATILAGVIAKLRQIGGVKKIRYS